MSIRLSHSERALIYMIRLARRKRRRFRHLKDLKGHTKLSGSKRKQYHRYLDAKMSLLMDEIMPLQNQIIKTAVDMTKDECDSEAW